MRITFFGAGTFAASSLQVLQNNAIHNIVAVYCPPPRPAKRGLKLTSCATADIARDLNLPLIECKASEAVMQSQTLSPQAVVVCDYGAILPLALWENSEWGAINIHPSLLPRWRGAAPIVHAILSGDDETGITIMHMNEALDAGDIIAQQKITIPPDINGGALSEQLAKMGGALLCETLTQLESQDASKTWKYPQDSALVTYASKTSSAMRLLDFYNDDAKTLSQKVRAFAPKPSAYLLIDNNPIKVMQAKILLESELDSDSKSLAAGTIIYPTRKGFAIKCKCGKALQLLSVQRAGGKVMDAADFMRGTMLSSKRVDNV